MVFQMGIKNLFIRYLLFSCLILLLLSLTSCRTLEKLRIASEGKNLIEYELFGSESINLKELKKIQVDGFSIADFQNPLVRRHVNLYTKRGRGTVKALAKKSAYFMPLIKPIFEKNGLPTDLAYLPLIESGFNPLARSHMQAAGMWQFMYTTGRMYGLEADYWVDERMDIVKSTEAAALHLKYLYKRFDDWLLALAAYNAGSGKISRAIKKNGSRSFWKIAQEGYIKPETVQYVPKFLAIASIIKNLNHYGFNPDLSRQWEDVRPYVLTDATAVELLAKSAGMPLQDFRIVNPAIRQWASPPSREFVVYIPKTRYESFVKNFESIAASERVTFRRYFVRIGDNLSKIAKRFSIPISPIVKINDFVSSDQIQAGEYIVVPIQGLKKANDLDKKSKGSVDAVKKGNRTSKKKDLPKNGLSQGQEYNEFVHLTDSDDTLYIIAKKYGVSIYELMQWNGIQSARALSPGRFLYIRKRIIDDNS